MNSNWPAHSQDASTLEASVSCLSTSLKGLRIKTAGAFEQQNPAFAFLHLPPEIRLAVYQAALVDNNDNIFILQTCRQINMEAHEILYQRSSSFSSQAKLFAWIQISRVSNLNRVRAVTLRLTDVDLDSLLERPSSKRQTRATIWSLYRDDLQKLARSLSALPNLSKLTVIPPKIGYSLLLRNMYHSFLEEIPQRCPKLRELEICDNDDLLEVIPALKEVRQVTFTSLNSNARVKPEEARFELFGGSNTDAEQLKKEPSRSSASPTARRDSRPKTAFG